MTTLLKDHIPVTNLAAIRCGGQVLFLLPVILYLSHKKEKQVLQNCQKMEIDPDHYNFKTMKRKDFVNTLNWFPFYDSKLFIKLCCRAVLGCITMTLYYTAFTYLPIGDTSCFMFAHTIVVSILAWNWIFWALLASFKV